MALAPVLSTKYPATMAPMMPPRSNGVERYAESDDDESALIKILLIK